MAIITGKPFSQYPLVTAPSQSAYFPAVDPTRATNDKNIRVPIGMINLSGDGQVIKTSITSGVSSQYISFSPAFTGVPYLYSSLETTNELYVFNLSGVTANGFNVVFSAPVASSDLKLCTFATTQVKGIGAFFAVNATEPGMVDETYLVHKTGQEIISGQKTFTDRINYPPVLNATSSIVSGVYYVNTGGSISLNLDGSPSNGRMYFIKNRGGTLTLSGANNIKFFTDVAKDTFSLMSGEAYIFMYDGYYWNVM